MECSVLTAVWKSKESLKGSDNGTLVVQVNTVNFRERGGGEGPCLLSVEYAGLVLNVHSSLHPQS